MVLVLRWLRMLRVVMVTRVGGRRQSRRELALHRTEHGLRMRLLLLMLSFLLLLVLLLAAQY